MTADVHHQVAIVGAHEWPAFEHLQEFLKVRHAGEGALYLGVYTTLQRHERYRELGVQGPRDAFEAIEEHAGALFIRRLRAFFDIRIGAFMDADSLRNILLDEAELRATLLESREHDGAKAHGVPI